MHKERSTHWWHKWGDANNDNDNDNDVDDDFGDNNNDDDDVNGVAGGLLLF